MATRMNAVQAYIDDAPATLTIVCLESGDTLDVQRGTLAAMLAEAYDITADDEPAIFDDSRRYLYATGDTDCTVTIDLI